MLADFITILLSLLLVISGAALVPFVLFSRIILEKYEKLYNGFIVAQLSMLVLALAYLLKPLDNFFLYKTFEFLSYGLFVVGAGLVVKNSTSIYLLLEQKKVLDEEVVKKTHELKKNVGELEESRTAMIHILRDLDKSNKKLENRAMDLEELRQTLNYLNSELSLESLLEKIPFYARELIGARYAAFGLLNNSGKEFKNFIASGMSEKELSKIKETPLPKGKGVLKALIKSKNPILIEDLKKEKNFEGFPTNHPEMCSFLGTSITLKGRPFGVLCIADDQRTFTEDDKILAHAFTTGVAAAIENARLYSDLEKAYTELLDLDRLKTDIISNVSHELRTPITISKGVFELLKKETSKDEMEKLLTMGDNSLNRLMEIVENLISAAKFHGGTYNISKEFIDLKGLVNNVLKSLEKKALQKNVLIKTSFSKDLKSIKGDSSELSRMLKNVVDNSIKFSKKEGGNVIIKADNFDSSVTISITDDGIGIPVDKIAKIFEPLYQIDATSTREYEGTGMGLAVSKSLVKSHGGRIWAESESGKGTTVHISLPVEGIDSFYKTIDWMEN